MGGEGGGRIGACEVQAREEGGEANKGGHMGEGLGAPGACYVGEHVVVRALGGDGPLFVVADFWVLSIYLSVASHHVSALPPRHHTATSSRRANGPAKDIPVDKINIKLTRSSEP